MKYKSGVKVSFDFKYYNEKIAEFKKNIINNDLKLYKCIYCDSIENLIRDFSQEDIFYCLKCLEKVVMQDEMVYNEIESDFFEGD